MEKPDFLGWIRGGSSLVKKKLTSILRCKWNFLVSEGILFANFDSCETCHRGNKTVLIRMRLYRRLASKQKSLEEGGETKKIPSLLMPGSHVWHMVSSVYLPIVMVNVGKPTIHYMDPMVLREMKRYFI